jgi:hypothetical protein
MIREEEICHLLNVEKRSKDAESGELVEAELGKLVEAELVSLPLIVRSLFTIKVYVTFFVDRNRRHYEGMLSSRH